MLLSLSVFFCYDRAYADFDGEWEYSISSGTATIIGYSGTSAEVSVPAKLGGVPVVSIKYYKIILPYFNGNFKGYIYTILHI